MKISIITATRNSCQTLERAIISYIDQTYQSKEYIIVDGLSTDCTLDIIAKYRQYIDVFVAEKPQGIYPALNKGIELASGQVIGFLHSDDFFADRQVLADVMERFEQGADIVYGDVVYVLNDGRIWRYWKAGKFHKRKLHFGWMPPHTTFFVRRQLYLDYGLYRQDMRIAADFEMVLRLMSKSVNVQYIPRILTIMSVGGESNRSLQNIWLKMKEDRRAAKLNGFAGWTTVFFKNLRKINQLRYMFLRPKPPQNWLIPKK